MGRRTLCENGRFMRLPASGGNACAEEIETVCRHKASRNAVSITTDIAVMMSTVMNVLDKNGDGYFAMTFSSLFT